MFIIHTCYVLTNPPIPSSPCNHIANLQNLFLYIVRELTQGLKTKFPCDCIVKTSYIKHFTSYIKHFVYRVLHILSTAVVEKFGEIIFNHDFHKIKATPDRRNDDNDLSKAIIYKIHTHTLSLSLPPSLSLSLPLSHMHLSISIYK